MGIREVYERDVQGRCGSRIDTAFGLSSSDYGADGTEVVFLDIDGLEGIDQGDTDGYGDVPAGTGRHGRASSTFSSDGASTMHSGQPGLDV